MSVTDNNNLQVRILRLFMVSFPSTITKIRFCEPVLKSRKMNRSIVKSTYWHFTIKELQMTNVIFSNRM